MTRPAGARGAGAFDVDRAWAEGWEGRAGGRLSMGRCLFRRMWALGGGRRCVVGGEGMGALKEQRMLVAGRCNSAAALLWS